MNEKDKTHTQVLDNRFSQFKTRAKRIGNGEWIEGFYVHQYDTHSMYLPNGAECEQEFDNYPIDPYTLCKSTGFCAGDKEIWENDIVEVIWCSGKIERYLMWWCREMSMMSAVPLEGIQFNGHDYWNGPIPTYEDFALMMQDPWGDIKSVEVVGNLFDNPELLHNKEEEKDER